MSQPFVVVALFEIVGMQKAAGGAAGFGWGRCAAAAALFEDIVTIFRWLNENSTPTIAIFAPLDISSKIQRTPELAP
jgi:hypothetical protein